MNSLVRTKYRNIRRKIRCRHYRVYVIAWRPIYMALEFTLHSIQTFANSLKFTDSTTVSSTGIFEGSPASSAFQWRLGFSAFYHIDKQRDRYFSKNVHSVAMQLLIYLFEHGKKHTVGKTSFPCSSTKHATEPPTWYRTTVYPCIYLLCLPEKTGHYWRLSGPYRKTPFSSHEFGTRSYSSCDFSRLFSSDRIHSHRVGQGICDAPNRKCARTRVCS